MCTDDCHSRAQCVLRLVPYVQCGSGAHKALVTVASLTLAAFGAGFPALCIWMTLHGTRAPLAMPVRFLLDPLRAGRWRAL